ncbi:MAG: hypothetical protein ACNS61_15945 [Candidatus Wenzhouxiangella sp. M2_3B_020]
MRTCAANLLAQKPRNGAADHRQQRNQQKNRFYVHDAGLSNLLINDVASAFLRAQTSGNK